MVNPFLIPILKVQFFTIDLSMNEIFEVASNLITFFNFFNILFSLGVFMIKTHKIQNILVDLSEALKL